MITAQSKALKELTHENKTEHYKIYLELKKDLDPTLPIKERKNIMAKAYLKASRILSSKYPDRYRELYKLARSKGHPSYFYAKS